MFCHAPAVLCFALAVTVVNDISELLDTPTTLLGHTATTSACDTAASLAMGAMQWMLTKHCDKYLTTDPNHG